MTRKQLAAELGEEAIIGSPADYRAAIDRRLFGLGRERYEQLLTLILTLRRPQLAKNLDPGKLSDTLTEWLRPLDDELSAEASRSFEDMEAVQRTLEGLAAADDAARAFLTGYSTYLRVHARWAADALAAAERANREAVERLSTAEDAVTGLRARHEQLKNSSAYQAHEQLADLERLVRTCADTAETAAVELRRRTETAQRAADDAEEAAGLLAELEAAVSRAAAALAAEAAAAGIAWSPADAAPDGLAERAGARAAARAEAVRAVRTALAAHRATEQARDLARVTLDRASAAAAEAEQAEVEAAGAVEAVLEHARARLDDWVRWHTTALTGLASERVAELTGELEQTGEPDASGLEAVLAAATADAQTALRDERAALRVQRGEVERELADLRAERDRIAVERDDAPAPHPFRMASRADRAGAPLWRLVRFADGLDDARAAGVEAALEAAGLLDAWVTAEPVTLAAGDSESYLEPGPAVPGRSLAELLVPEDGVPVPAGRVTAVLASIAVLDPGAPGAAAPEGASGTNAPGTNAPRGPGAVVGTDGRFAQGVQLGVHYKPVAEYVGTTARTRRRVVRLADCDARIAAATGQLAELDRRIARSEAALEAHAEAVAALPRTGAIVMAKRRHGETAGRLRAAHGAAEAARLGHDEAIAACGAAERALRRIGAEHGIAVAAADEAADAVRRFEHAVSTLTGRRREEIRQRVAHTAAARRLSDAIADRDGAAATEQAARRRHTEDAAKLDVLHRTVGAGCPRAPPSA